MRGLYCPRNDYEQIYSFVNISSWKSYQLAEMSANSRNRTFSQTSDPGVECFAPFPTPEENALYHYFGEYIFRNPKMWQFSTFFKNWVFRILNHIFKSYEFFGTTNRYHFISRSLHLCFQSILKISFFFDFHHFLSENDTKKLFSQKFRYLPESK